MQAVVLAGGQGTRLKPFTFRSPKQLLPLANKPFILYLVEYLNGFGIREIIFSLCYRADDIMSFLGTDSKSGTRILFSVESEPLGTAGALKNVENYLKEDSVLVMNGDLLTDIDVGRLIETHRRKKATVTIALKEVDDPSSYGLVLTDRDGHVKRFIEKPTDTEVADRTINAGIYVIEPKVLSRIPPRKNFSFERDLYPSLLEEKVPFYSEVFHSYWLDVGTLPTYFRAHRDILAEKIKVKVPGKRSEKRPLWMGTECRIHPGAQIADHVVIGNKVILEEGAAIGEFTALGDKCVVRKGAKVADSILFSGVTVGERVRIRDSILGVGAMIEDDCLIRPGNVLGDATLVTRGSMLPAAL